ncbi:MucBP domain-containing protein, partial [Lacticaseibacillus baoqingensis]
MQGNVVQADTTTDTDAGTYTKESDSGAANATNTAVLKTQPAAQTATAVPQTPATPTTASLEITALAAAGNDGVVTVTGTTAANALVTATTADGASQSVTADTNGHFSVQLTTTTTIVLKATLAGVTSEPTAVVPPANAAAANTAATTAQADTHPAAAGTAAAAAQPDASAAQPADAEPAAVTTAGSATESVDTSPEAVGNATNAVAATASTPATTAAAISPEVASAGDVDAADAINDPVILVDPTDDELAAAKALAAETFKKTGIAQLIQAVAADDPNPSTEQVVYDKSFLETLQLTSPNAATSVDGQIIVKAGVREVKDGDSTKKYLAYDQPITVTFDHFSNIGKFLEFSKAKSINMFDLSTLLSPASWMATLQDLVKGLTTGDFSEEQLKQLSATIRDESEVKDTIDVNTAKLMANDDDNPIKEGDLFRLTPVTGAGALQVGVFGAEALDKPSLNQINDVHYASPTFDWDALAHKNDEDNSVSVTFTLSADQVKQAFGDKGGYLYVKIPGKMSSLKITDLIVPGADGSIGTDAKVEVVDTPTDTSTDTPTDTPDTTGFPVTYKYVDENGQEIPNSAQSTKVPEGSKIDFNPLDPPSGYTFDPAKTTLDVGSAIAGEIQNIVSGVKDFASLNTTLGNMQLTDPSQYADYGSDELTITYKGTKDAVKVAHPATVIFADKDGNPLLNAKGDKLRVDQPLGTHTEGTSVPTDGFSHEIEGYTMIGEDPIPEHYYFTDEPNQIVILKYEKNDAGGTGTGTGTDTPTAIGKITVNLVGEDHHALVVPSDPNFQQTYYPEGYIGTTIADGTINADGIINKEAPGFTIIEDQTIGATFTDKDQTLLIVYKPVVTKGTITVNLVDENNQPVKNTDGKPSIDLEGNIGDPITSVALNKDVPGHKITTDGTTDATFTKTAQTLTIKYAPVVTKGTITVNLVDENNQPIKNTDGQSSIDLKGNIGDSITSVALNKDVPGHKITTDGTTDAIFTKTAQTLTIKYATDGPRVFTPGNPGSTLNGDPITVTSRYLIGTVQANVKYNGDGAPEEKKGSPIQIYRTATLDASGAPVYTPWTTNSTGVGGNDTDVLLTPITESDIPTVANKVGTIVDETNKAITSADLPLVGKKVTASDGSVLIDGSQNTNIGGKYLTNFIATRVVNYGANQPDLQWHDAPKDPKDPLYKDTHKALHPTMMMIKDGETTPQDNNEDDVVLTRQYQIDDNDPDSGVKDYGPWIVDDTGKFMTVGYTPVIYDGYKASPAKIDQNTQDDDHKTVTEELAAMTAETADQDKKITFTINYDKEKAELVEHPAPNEPSDVNYHDTHKFLNVTINGDQNGQKKQLYTGKVEFNRTYFTEKGDTTNKVVEYGDWQQAAPFATFTPEPVDGATPTPAQVTETTVGDDGQSIKQAAAGLLAATDIQSKDITITVTYAKAEAVQGTGTVHYVYQNVGGIELQPPVTVSGPEGTDYSTQYKIPDTLNNDGKDLPDAGGTLDTSILYYYATADINGGQINSLPDNGSADAAFKTDGQDIWVIYVAKPKASAADTVTAEEIEGDAEHPNGGTRITVKHVDGSPDTVTTVWNGDDGTDGASAFDIWKAADPDRKDATEGEFLASLQGDDGKSAYELWEAQDGNDGKSETDFLNSLKGANGTDGKSAFEIWSALPGNDKKTEAEFIESLKGAKGADGTNGTDGASAFDIWKAANPDRKDATEGEFLASLQGDDGKSAYEVWKAQDGNGGKSETDFLNSLKGANGTDGKSAFEIWSALPGNDKKTEAEFIESLKGAKGADGTNGASAYEVWKNGKDAKNLNNDNTIDEADYAIAIKGDTGDDGYSAWLKTPATEDINKDGSIDDKDKDLNKDGSVDEEDFIQAIKGDTGAAGADGASAYDAWKKTPEATDLNDDGTVDEKDFVISIKGDTGDDGYSAWLKTPATE